MKNNRKQIIKALDALDRYFMNPNHEIVETYCGPQSTANGYQISDISIFDENVRITVWMLDRSVQQNDDVRGGDEAQFYYVGIEGECFSDEEFTAYIENRDIDSPSLTY